ncbi:MAG: glycosyltransferase [Solobacterium sp.]|nr:glycosyltransferase [Solobacterium sp.]
MSNKVYISVVLPVFNVAPYIRKCIESLRNQTFKDLEFIFIGDACTDASMEIVEEYKKKDERIITIYNETNIGSGPSRNKGIKIAKGEYLSFVDPDDWISENFYEALYQKALETNDDIIKGDIRCINEEGKDITSDVFCANNSVAKDRLSNGEPFYMCFSSDHVCALYRTAFLKEQSITYGEQHVGQDSVFLLNACIRAKSFSFVDEAIYYYLYRNDSAAHTNNFQRNLNALEVFEKRVQIVAENGIDDNARQFFIRMGDYYLSVFLEYVDANNEKNASEILHYIRTFESILIKVDPTGILFTRMKYYSELKQIEASIRPEVPVSVIIPMYNCSTYLPTLFDDLFKQTFQDFEVICVNDGSTDETYHFIYELSHNHANVFIITQSNRGAGAARNTGLAHAHGEYVIWIDADDRYNPAFIEELYKASKKHETDITICLYEDNDHLSNKHRDHLGFYEPTFPENTVVDPRDIKLVGPLSGFRITNKMYRRQFVLDNQLKFSETIVANDNFFNYASVYCAKRILGIPKHLLTVEKYINPNSITAKRSNHTDDIIITTEEIYTFLKQHNLEKSRLQDYVNVFRNAFLYNAEFPYNHRFVTGIVETLCTKEPWISMSPKEFYDRLWKDCCVDITQKLIDTLQVKLNEKGNEDNYLMEIQRLNQRLATIMDVERIAEQKYHRVFDIHRPKSKIESLNKQITSLQQQNQELTTNLEQTNARLNRELHSWNYKIGYYLTYIPKKIFYTLFRKKD